MAKPKNTFGFGTWSEPKKMGNAAFNEVEAHIEDSKGLKKKGHNQKLKDAGSVISTASNKILKEIEERAAFSLTQIEHNLEEFEKNLEITESWNLSKYIQRVQKRKKFGKDAKHAISLLKKIVKTTEHIFHLHQQEGQLLEQLKNAPKAQRAQLIQLMTLDNKSIYVDYVSIRSYIGKAWEFVVELNAILGEEETFDLQSITVQKNTMHKVLNSMIAQIQSALILMAQNKKQVEEIIQQITQKIA